MHYKMRDQIRFKIGKEEKNIQEKWIEIPEGTEHIQMMIEMPEEFRYMAFLFLEDPKKEIRFQKLLGYGQQNPGIGKSTKDTTIGGVPGEIYPGTWKIGIGIFTEYVAQKLGEQTGEIVLTVSDRTIWLILFGVWELAPASPQRILPVQPPQPSRRTQAGWRR